MIYLALYRGPIKKPEATAREWITHIGICLRTLSRHSHAELLIDGVCYSSSARDGGVRSKSIDLWSGRWDLYPLPGADKAAALAWFDRHKGARYDWPGILHWVLPVRHHPDRFVCFEAVAEMLGLPKPHRWHARSLRAYARRLVAVGDGRAHA